MLAIENSPDVRDPRGLTRSEAIVASLAARGHSDKLVAYELGTRIGTVSALLARVYRKLRVRTRADLVDRLRAPREAVPLHLPGGETVLAFTQPTPTPSPFLAKLSPAEREVVALVTKGHRNDEIAELRGTSPRTVAHQLTRIYEKLGVGSRAELCVRVGTNA